MSEKKKKIIIQEAYGGYWPRVRLYVDMENGWLLTDKFRLSDFIKCDIDEHGFERPVSIRGVFHNNGWICIEDAMPQADRPVEFCLSGERQKHQISAERFREMVDYRDKNPEGKKGITHWRYVPENLDPVY